MNTKIFKMTVLSLVVTLGVFGGGAAQANDKYAEIVDLVRDAGGDLATFEKLKLLIKQGADIKAADKWSTKKYSPIFKYSLLCWAINASYGEASDDQLVKLLLDNGADVNARCGDYTPLHFAVQYGQINSVKTLLENGANVNAKTLGGHPQTPLDLASGDNERKLKSLLLNHGKSKKGAGDWWEESPGIFVRWCTKTCSKANVIGGSTSYSLMEVWCKARSCGNIYARVNILQGDTVVGWTNDSAYASKGQKAILTFETDVAGKAQLVEFSATL